MAEVSAMRTHQSELNSEAIRIPLRETVLACPEKRDVNFIENHTRLKPSDARRECHKKISGSLPSLNLLMSKKYPTFELAAAELDRARNLGEPADSQAEFMWVYHRMDMPALPNIERYYASLAELIEVGGSDNELNIRPAFPELPGGLLRRPQGKAGAGARTGVVERQQARRHDPGTVFAWPAATGRPRTPTTTWTQRFRPSSTRVTRETTYCSRTRGRRCCSRTARRRCGST